MAAAEGVLQTVLAGAVRGGMQLDGDRLAVVVRGQLQDGGRDGDEQPGVHVREGEQPPLLLRPARAHDARGQRGAAVAVVRQVTLQLRAVLAGPDVGHLRQVVEVLRPRLLLEVRAVLKQAELALLAADQVVAEVLRAQVRPLGHHLHLHARRSLRQQLVEVVLHLLWGGKATGVDVVVIGLDHAMFGAVCSGEQVLVRLFACFAALLAVGADETNPSLGAEKWFRQYWNGFVVDDRIIELVRFTSYPAP